ncbi:unnamed protein product [Alternaria alternata]
MLPPLTFVDKAALAELLRRKTEYISAGVKPHITLSLDTILEPSAQHQFFPHQVDNVNEGATFAGILKYRTRRVQLPTFYYESSRIHEHCRGNALLQGLVAAMPGVRDIGSYVEVFDIGDLSDFKIMNLDEPDQSYEDEVEEMTARDDDAMEVDEDLCINDGADLNLWISKRDGSDL